MMQQQSNGDDTRSDGAPEPGDASRGWQRTKRWSDSESWHLCRASLWSRWHGLAHGSWLRLALRTGDHCAVDLTSCWIGDPVGFEKEEGLCGTLHGVRARCLHEGLGMEVQSPRLPVPSLLRLLLLRLATGVRSSDRQPLPALDSIGAHGTRPLMSVSVLQCCH